MNQSFFPHYDLSTNRLQTCQSLVFSPITQYQIEVMTCIQKALVRIEKDTFKVFADKKETKFSQECIAFFEMLPLLAELLCSSDAWLEFNPYIQVIFEELPNPMHQQLLNRNYSFLSKEYFVNTVHRFKFALTQKKCALKLSKRKTLIKEQANSQKKYCSRLLSKQQELNCFLVELPLFLDSGLLNQESAISYEKDTVKIMKEYFQNIHAAQVFDQKLCDIQWRIVKSIHGSLIGQALIYMLGAEAEVECEPELKKLWINTTQNRIANYSSIGEPSIASSTIYMGNGIALKAWKKKLDLLHAHLEFFSYKANGICFKWKSYTGNFNTLKTEG